MKIRDLLQYVDDILENRFNDSTKIRWINDIEADIQVLVLLTSPDGIVQYTENDMDAELLVPAPHKVLYEEYLMKRICLAQQEPELANMHQAEFDQAYRDYTRWVADNLNPGNGMATYVQYYLTAYQIAVKHGYQGTEEEWLLSLKGESGEGLVILDQLATPEQLPKTGKPGDAYLVGEVGSSDLWIWNNTEAAFKNYGPLRGKEGYSPIRGVDYWTEADKQEILTEAESGVQPAIDRADAAAAGANRAAGTANAAADTAKKAAGTADLAAENAGTAADTANKAAADIKARADAGEFDGQDGYTPAVGSNGNWFINGQDTGHPARGPKGDPGHTPVIGDNGNWFINGVDTGYPARGPKGDSYTLIHATADTLGGIMAEPAQPSDTKKGYIGKDNQIHFTPDVLVVRATNEGGSWVADVGSETIRSFGGDVILKADVSGVQYSYRYQRYGSVTDKTGTYTGAVFDQPNIQANSIERIEVIVDLTGKIHVARTPYNPPEVDLKNFVKNTRKINGKTLEADIELTAADVGARPDTWTPSAADVKARPDTWTPSAADVGARPDTWTPSAADVGAIPKTAGTAGQFAQSDGSGGITFVTLKNLDTEAR